MGEFRVNALVELRYAEFGGVLGAPPATPDLPSFALTGASAETTWAADVSRAGCTTGRVESCFSRAGNQLVNVVGDLTIEEVWDSCGGLWSATSAWTETSIESMARPFCPRRGLQRQVIETNTMVM
jgi:hypothetical protein